MPRQVDTRKRQAVLDAAADMFLARGYEGVSIDAVADAAGVARRTVYNRFSSKDALFAGVAEHVWSGLVFPATMAKGHRSPDAQRAIGEIAIALVEFWRRPQAVAFLRMVIAEGPRFPQLAATYFEAGKLPIFRSLVARLVALSHSGTLSGLAADRAELAARQLIGLVHEPLLWPRLLGAPEADDAERAHVVSEAVVMFLARYGPASAEPGGRDEHATSRRFSRAGSAGS